MRCRSEGPQRGVVFVHAPHALAGSSLMSLHWGLKVDQLVACCDRLLLAHETLTLWLAFQKGYKPSLHVK